MNLPDEELFFITEAIHQASLSQGEDGRVSPRVGSVVVRDGKMLAAARRGELGPGDHAEFTVLEKKLADDDVRGATLFTTLEPCTQRSPEKTPCADRIIDRGISRVVIGTMDPNPDISGKGCLRLRDAGIEIAMFPGEMMSRVEELNSDFSRRHRLSRGALDEMVAELSPRSLDSWYIAINRIYGERNRHVPLTYVFAHLVELVGGLSCLASEKTKDSVVPAGHVQKAIAWWLALCGKAQVRTASSVIWRKFPGVCPYCERCPHNDDVCMERKEAGGVPDWPSLAARGASAAPPERPSDWLRMFREIYPGQGDVYGPSFARLSEELGELGEAVRLFDESPYYFLSEAADVFAWLMRVENIRETKAKRPLADIGRELNEGIARSYPDFCMDCDARPCRCPPVLKRTVGRIAKEVPRDLAESAFMAADERRALFGS